MLRAAIERSKIDPIGTCKRQMRGFTQRASFLCVLADLSRASETKKFKQKYPLSFS